MNSQKTFARPYAKAIFELALKDNTVSYWSDVLIILSDIASDAGFQSVYKNPQYTARQIIDIFMIILKKADLYNNYLENFILLLAYYKRLLLLPWIADLFQESRDHIEKTVQVNIESVLPFSTTLRQSLQQHLEKRLGREVSLNFIENPQLIGGVIISAGDWVVDYSVSNQLEKLKQALMS